MAAGMRHESQQAPAVVEGQRRMLAEPIGALVQRLRRRRPAVVVTCARGSSAHAATFAKHLIERYLGIPVAAAAPSVASVYGRSLELKDQLFLAISQSGRSDDLVEMATMARAKGALTAAVVNDPDSLLARACEIVLPICAGPELSVAATKSFSASLAALLRMTAHWASDEAMEQALARLPDRLAQASTLDWSEALGPLARSSNAIVIGRGPTLAPAREAALKLKETCQLHGEAFSAAEFRHGPIALVSDAYPILAFRPNDETAGSVSNLVTDLRHKGASVFVAEAGGRLFGRLPTLLPDHPDADAICLIQSFYAFVADLAVRRGTDMHQPRHLQKVTRTR